MDVVQLVQLGEPGNRTIAGMCGGRGESAQAEDFLAYSVEEEDHPQ